MPSNSYCGGRAGRWIKNGILAAFQNAIFKCNAAVWSDSEDSVHFVHEKKKKKKKSGQVRWMCTVQFYTWDVLDLYKLITSVAE